MLNKLDKLYHKVRKHGIGRLFNILGYMCWQRFRMIRFPLAVNPRFYYYLAKLILVPNFAKKRILGIWDYKSLPWDVGDPLVFIETLSILKIKYDAEEIDICVVYDRDKPLGKRTKFLGDPITPENHQEYSLEYLPLYSTCPYLGTVYQFNSRREFYRFLKMNYDCYDIFPPLSQHLGETYDYYDSAASEMKMIEEFFDSYGHIPFLRIGERDQSWARWFYLNYLPEGSISIALSLKMTSHDPIRNADPAVWLSFMDRCKIAFPELVFIIIGLREEVFDGLRERENVVIAKDHGTSLVEDFALIRTSLLYMGIASGINTIALFSDIPYLIFQLPNIHRYGLEEGRNWSFANDRQRIFSTKIPVTPELLFKEFKELYSQLDQSTWRDRVLKKAYNKSSHPSAVVLQSVNSKT
ncbi:MAG: hypothetical protein NT140_05985 [Deltaproteobacteria bacterium]|nr:hypothetical protein [Deltaproteobacteria bacterium]